MIALRRGIGSRGFERVKAAAGIQNPKRRVAGIQMVALTPRFIGSLPTQG